MGDFERTFGAGADVVSIIDGFSRPDNDRPTSLRQTSKTTFSSYKEATAWARAHPGEAVVRSSDGNGWTVAGNTKITSRADTHAGFICVNPEDVEVVSNHDPYEISNGISEILASDDPSMARVKDHIKRYCAMNGITSQGPISTTAPIIEISKALLLLGYQLYPVTDAICLIDRTNGDGVDGALITEKHETVLLAGGVFFQKIHKAISCPSSPLP